MNFVFKLILLLLLIDIIFSFQSCPNTANPPVNIEIDATKTISPILYNKQEYKTILVGNKIFLNKDTYSFIGKASQQPMKIQSFALKILYSQQNRIMNL